MLLTEATPYLTDLYCSAGMVAGVAGVGHATYMSESCHTCAGMVACVGQIDRHLMMRTPAHTHTHTHTRTHMHTHTHTHTHNDTLQRWHGGTRCSVSLCVCVIECH